MILKAIKVDFLIHSDVKTRKKIETIKKVLINDETNE